jgi:hypothetical protein
VIHDHHAGKKQNISSGFSVFLSVGHLGKRRWVTSEKRRRPARSPIWNRTQNALTEVEKMALGPLFPNLDTIDLDDEQLPVVMIHRGVHV